MVGLDPIIADLVKGVVQGVHHGIFLTFDRLLLQGGIDLVHSQGSGSCVQPLPSLDVHFQIGGAELKAFKIFNGPHFLGGCHDTGAAVGGTQQLKASRIANGGLDLIAEIAVPDIHKVFIAVEHVRHGFDVGQRSKGGQGTDGLHCDIGYAHRHTLQDLRGGAQAGSAIQFNFHTAVGQLIYLFGKQGTHVIGIIALGGVQMHLPGVFGITRSTIGAGSRIVVGSTACSHSRSKKQRC